jgi:hypothetical protein
LYTFRWPHQYPFKILWGQWNLNWLRANQKKTPPK